MSDCPMLFLMIVITLLIAIIKMNHPSCQGYRAMTWMSWHDSSLMNLISKHGWHVCTSQIEGAPADWVQVKHLQDEFEESKGGFIPQQRQGGGGGGRGGWGVVVLKLCSSSFRKSLLPFPFSISGVCSIQFAWKHWPTVHLLCLSLSFWETTGLYNVEKKR